MAFSFIQRSFNCCIESIYREVVKLKIEEYIADGLVSKFSENPSYKKITIKRQENVPNVRFMYLNNGKGHTFAPLVISDPIFDSFKKMTLEQFDKALQEIYDNYEKGVRII